MERILSNAMWARRVGQSFRDKNFRNKNTARINERRRANFREVKSIQSVETQRSTNSNTVRASTSTILQGIPGCTQFEN